MRVNRVNQVYISTKGSMPQNFGAHKNSPAKTAGKILLGASAVLAAGTAGYAAGVRYYEKQSYKMTVSLFNNKILPEFKNCCKLLKLKTAKNMEFDAMDINPENSSKYLIYCNGMYTSMDIANQKIYRILLRSHNGIVGFNYPGHPASKSEFSKENAIESLKTVHSYLLQKGIKPENIGIIAHSMGCAVASEFAAKNKVKFAVLMCPFNKATDTIKNFVSKSEALPKFVKTVVKLVPSNLQPIKYRFNNEKYLKQIDFPVLIMASKDDETIPVYLTRKLQNKLSNKTNIEYREFERGGHNIDKNKLQGSLDFIKKCFGE